MRMVKRKSVALAIAASILLSGCGLAENYGPIAISVVDGQPVMAICVDDTIKSIEVLQLGPGADRKDGWVLVWSATGSTPVHSGDVFVLDELTEGFAKPFSVESWNFQPGYEYQSRIQFAANGWFGPVFKVPPSGFGPGKWGTTSGRTESSPCA